MREQDKNHPIEVVGRSLREMMPFLKKNRKAANTPAPALSGRETR
jgi:hypothetical protein